MAESIPPALQPPVAVALAKLVKTFPGPAALPGRIYAEPKSDGYRMCALVRAGGVSLWSRQGKDLTRYFPDLVEAVADQVPGVIYPQRSCQL